MKGVRIVMLLTVWLCAGLAVDVGGAPADGWARTRKPHVEGFGAPKVRSPRLRKPRPPSLMRPIFRNVTLRRADGTVLHGYRDSTGTHLTSPDGKMTHCQRSDIGLPDINIACRRGAGAAV